MKTSTLIVAFASPWLAAAAQTPSTPTSQTPPPVQVSTAPANSGSDAWRPGKGTWHKDCDADVAKFCPGVTTREQVEQCLRSNEKRLSDACQDIREKEGHHRRAR